MHRYDLNGWTIISKAILPLKSTETLDVNRQTVYLFDAPLHATKMIQYVPISFIETEVLEDLALFLREVREEQRVMAVNKTLFFHKYPHATLSDLLTHLVQYQEDAHRKKSITLLGLGDVGSMLTIGLKLLGGNCISSIGIYDLSEQQRQRWEMELSQITENPEIKVKSVHKEALFESDVFIFCASKAIPKVGEESQATGEMVDVRMIQYEENSKIIALYAKMAREHNFKGLFAVVSDPVDLLCKAVYAASNQHEGVYDYKGLLPEQIVGFGLGVMDGRAKYYSDQLNLSYRENGRCFGPHGKDLVVSENIESIDEETDLLLTHKVITANLEMRALGYKPFVAPALSSGAHAITNMLKGEWHYSAQYLNGVYWGAKNRCTPFGIQYEYIKLSEHLKGRIRASYKKLEETWEILTS